MLHLKLLQVNMARYGNHRRSRCDERGMIAFMAAVGGDTRSIRRIEFAEGISVLSAARNSLFNKYAREIATNRTADSSTWIGPLSGSIFTVVAFYDIVETKMIEKKFWRDKPKFTAE